MWTLSKTHTILKNKASKLLLDPWIRQRLNLHFHHLFLHILAPLAPTKHPTFFLIMKTLTILLQALRLLTFTPSLHTLHSHFQTKPFILILIFIHRILFLFLFTKCLRISWKCFINSLLMLLSISFISTIITSTGLITKFLRFKTFTIKFQTFRFFTITSCWLFLYRFILTKFLNNAFTIWHTLWRFTSSRI